MNNVDLFRAPIRSVKVNDDVYAHLYSNGVININGKKYMFYSMSEAIQKYKESHYK
tara:strand:- start:203 stop:370 length:168 start_codon:yes stop_codon:yes gene_type:complete